MKEIDTSCTEFAFCVQNLKIFSTFVGSTWARSTLAKFLGKSPIHYPRFLVHIRAFFLDQCNSTLLSAISWKRSLKFDILLKNGLITAIANIRKNERNIECGIVLSSYSSARSTSNQVSSTPYTAYLPVLAKTPSSAIPFSKSRPRVHFLSHASLFNCRYAAQWMNMAF